MSDCELVEEGAWREGWAEEEGGVYTSTECRCVDEFVSMCEGVGCKC